MSDLEVKVYRHSGNEEEGEVYNGWFYSKVYAIDGNEFLVYDDGSLSAFDDYAPHFEWVCFDEFYEDHCSNTYHSLVELSDRRMEEEENEQE